MSPLKVTITPEQQAAMQERMAEVWAPFMRAFAELAHDAYEFGKSANHPGITDAAQSTAAHMGNMIDQLRSLQAARVAELRAENRAAVVAPVVSPAP